MAWPKIKNIIILMLLVTNLCLLAFVGWREIRDWQLQDKALEQAVSFLAERGIQVDERIVPRSAELPPMSMRGSGGCSSATAAGSSGPTFRAAPSRSQRGRRWRSMLWRPWSCSTSRGRW